MAGRRGLVAGALLAVGVAAGGGLLLPDGALASLEARAVAWTSGSPAPVVTPARKAPRKPARPTRKKAALQAAAKQDPKAAGARRSGSGVDLACSCPKKKAAAGARLQAVQPPQVVTGQNPPSAVLVGPGAGGVDRGIADTGTHSDGTWPEYRTGRRYQPGSQADLGATATAATATTGRLAVTWLDIGDPATITYRVGYQPQTWVKASGGSSWTYPAITWVNVPPLGAEGTQTWTLPNATRGLRYTVWLEVDVSTPEDTIGSTRMLLGQQNGVLVP